MCSIKIPSVSSPGDFLILSQDMNHQTRLSVSIKDAPHPISGVHMIMCYLGLNVLKICVLHINLTVFNASIKLILFYKVFVAVECEWNKNVLF